MKKAKESLPRAPPVSRVRIDMLGSDVMTFSLVEDSVNGIEEEEDQEGLLPYQHPPCLSCTPRVPPSPSPGSFLAPLPTSPSSSSSSCASPSSFSSSSSSRSSPHVNACRRSKQPRS
eukprot:755253-Hanusia_phi.AAC.1